MLNLTEINLLKALSFLTCDGLRKLDDSLKSIFEKTLNLLLDTIYGTSNTPWQSKRYRDPNYFPDHHINFSFSTEMVYEILLKAFLNFPSDHGIFSSQKVSDCKDNSTRTIPPRDPHKKYRGVHPHPSWPKTYYFEKQVHPESEIF